MFWRLLALCGLHRPRRRSHANAAPASKPASVARQFLRSAGLEQRKRRCGAGGFPAQLRRAGGKARYRAAMGGAGYAGTVADWRGVCADAQRRRHGIFRKTTSRPMRVSGSDGLFTGYYEPQIRGSRTRHGAFQTPVYGLPRRSGARRSGPVQSQAEGRAHLRQGARAMRWCPMPTAPRSMPRASDAPVLFYTDDPIAFFFLQIQGSGRVVFDDGSTARIAYAGENGQPYTAIGRTLIAEDR